MDDNQPASIDSLELGMERKLGLPPGLMKSIRVQETGGNAKYTENPSEYHYPLNKEGRRIAGHTGQVSTAFGPYGILESTGAKPGYGVGALKDKSLEEQVRFAAEYIGGRIKSAGSLEAGLAGYGEGAKYANSVIKRMGGSPSMTKAQDDVPAVAPVQRPDGWPTLPTARNRAQPEQPILDQRPALIAGAASSSEAARDTSASRAQTEAATAAQEAQQAERDATGFGAVFDAGRHDPRMNPLFTALDWINKDTEKPPEGWSYAAMQDEIEAGRTDEEREYLRENVTGPQSLLAAQAQLAYRADLDKTYGTAGGTATFFGSMAAGMMDPLGFAAGLGAGKALSAVGVGSRVLANAGRPGAAATSFIGENVLVNVGLEGMQDYMGEVKTTADYAMAAASGALLAAPFTRGAIRPDIDAHIGKTMDDLTTSATNEQLKAGDDVVTDLGLTNPKDIAVEVQKREQKLIDDAVRADLSDSTFRERMLDRDLMEHHRDALEGRDVGDVTPPPPDIKGEVVKPINENVYLAWKLRDDGKGGFKLKDLLEEVTQNPRLKGEDLSTAKYFLARMSDQIGQVTVAFREKGFRADFDPNTQNVNLESGIGANLKSLKTKVGVMSNKELFTVIHEAGHAMTHSRIEAALQHGAKAGAELDATVKQMQNLMGRYQQHVMENVKHPAGSDAQVRTDYAFKNLHEFAAQTWSDPNVREVLKAMPGKEVGGKMSSAWDEMVNVLARLLGFRKDETGLSEATKLLDKLLSQDISNVSYKSGEPALQAPGPSPQQLTSFAEKYAQGLHARAKEFLARNPIQTKKLKTLTEKIGGLSDGLILAGSKNPIMQMFASLAVETTTGAAGRLSTVVSRRHTLHKQLVGNAQLDYDGAASAWAKANGKSRVKMALGGDGAKQFDDAVYTEILNRRQADYAGGTDVSVNRAADALEGLFERSRRAQVNASVLGADRLPGSSRGYVPRALDSGKLQAMSTDDLGLLHGVLSEQFQTRMQMDKKFADALAKHYTTRQRRRGQGGETVDAIAAGGDGSLVIRDTLEDMTTDPQLRDRALAAMSKLGQGHTKRRLDLDLRSELRPGLTLMDVYNTNPLTLARSYAARVSGNVAMTERGILGIQGVRQMRDAAGTPVSGSELPTAKEFDAYDRVVAEIMGTHYAGRVVSAGATNLGLIVNLQKLGSLVFTQFADTWSMVHTLGVNSMIKGVPTLGRHIKEAGVVNKGGASTNPITRTVEYFGGELGTDNYKMVSRLDPPDALVAEYTNQAGLGSRLLRAGSMLQAKVTGFRALLAGQHRMVAEQVTIKAMRFIREGGDDVALRDMGFTPELTAKLREEIDNITKWDANGNITELDLTKVSDPVVAEAFSESVHRGVSQIIMGTYIGERGKWASNDYLRTLLQLRTFGLTSMEKQWSRTGHTQGYAKAWGFLIAQMALSLPIHVARVQAGAIGREDREQYLKDNMNPVALARATMNYASLSGLTGDVLDTLIGAAGGWGGQETKELLGARNQSTGVGRLVPGFGSVDQALRTVSGQGDAYSAMKQLPFANIWYLVPLMNLAKKEN